MLSGAWTIIPQHSAADVAPAGDGFIGMGKAAICTWHNNAFALAPESSSAQCIEVVWVDVESAPVAWSYSANGGPWTNGPIGRGTNNLIKTTLQDVSVPVGGTFAVRCANASGASVTAAFTGVIPWTNTNGPIATPMTEDVGIVRHNLGRSGNCLANPNCTTNPNDASLSGGNTPFYRPSSGSSSGNYGFDILDLIQPDLIIVGYRNDMGEGEQHGTPTTTAQWAAGLSALVNYVDERPEWGNGGADVMMWSYWVDTQIRLIASQYATVYDQAAAYRATTKAVATNLGCPVTDTYDYCNEILGYSTIAQFESLEAADELHPGQSGANLIAARLISSLDGSSV